MGNLLKLLAREETRKDDLYDVFVDFENCEPKESEKAVWDKIQLVLDEANIVLKGLRGYTGAQEVIRSAISNPQNEELQEKAWVGVCPLVEQLKKYYEFSLLLENNVPLLLQALCSNDMSAKEHLEKQQALVKQFAEVLDFVIKFDDIKMVSPVIQNDFSYYRRTQSRRRMVTKNASAQGNEECVPHEIANRMSLFYAHATPMLKMLSDTTSTFVSQHKDLPVENTTDCLCTMANICRVMIENPDYCQRFKNQETKSFCLRVMVGVIILYDHVHPVGAFAKTSGIDIKGSIKLLKEQRETSVEGLLNALRYTTKHLNDENTPKSVKALLLD